MFFYREKIKLRETIDLVGDPTVDESVWLPACAAMGNTALVRTEPTVLVRHGQAVVTALATTYSILGGLGIFIFATFMAGFIFTALTGLSLDHFMDQSGPIEGIGFVATAIGGLGFWQRLSFPQGRLANSLGLALVTVSVWLSWSSGRSELATSLSLGTLFYFPMSWFAAELRQAFPKTINARGTINSAGAASSLAGSCMMLLLISAFCRLSLFSMPSTTPDATEITRTISLFCMLMVLHSMAVTVSTRSVSLSACTALATLLQTPFAIGIGSIVIGLGGISLAAVIAPDYLNSLMSLIQYSHPHVMSASLTMFSFLSFVCVLFLTAISLVTGAALGTTFNKLTGVKSHLLESKGNNCA